MSAADITVVVICLVVGYGLVSAYYDGKQGQSAHPSGERQEEERRANGQDQRGSADPHDQPGATDADWHRVLSVAPSASTEEIKAAYRRRMAEYHPDKVARLGAELRALAETKSKQINAAFERAMRERG